MRYWAAGFLLTVLLFGGALLGAGKDTGTSRPVPDADPGQTGTVPGQSAADGAVLLRGWGGEQVVEMTMAEYLPGVVRGEMPASFHQQALDAQAVAERTFICYHMASGRKAEHPDADVCMDYHCCNAYTSAQAAAEKWGEHAAEYEAKIQQAVRDTDGQVILYNGQPILAAFHSSSAGVTANSGDVWVSTLPYLHSVKSPEGEGSVPNYYSVRELPAAEFQQTFLAAHPEASFAGAPETWITGRTENASGRVETVTIGGVTVEGRRYLGFLSLPTLERELPVLLDWDMEGLKGSPARYAGSFGGGGLVIGAHNYDRHFGGLSRLRSGDAVYLTDGAGTVHRYVVERVETLAPEDVAEMTDTQWDLTLFTCTYGGQSRVTVRCTAAGADGDG